MLIDEALNAIGVSLFANPTAAPVRVKLGKDLVLAAVAIQIAVILTFFVMAAMFHVRCSRAGFLTGRDQKARRLTTPLWTLYASMVLIFVRCIFRLVEKTAFKSVRIRDIEELRRLSPLVRHEWFFYVFEAALMLVNSVIWNVWHPGRFLPRSRRTHLTEDGVEVTAERKVDARSLVVRAGHVLTFGVLFRRKEEKGEWSEMGEYPAGDA